MALPRRSRLALVIITAAALALGAVPLSKYVLPQAVVSRATTPIQHVIIIMKENHAFDNYFGTFPGVDGVRPDMALPDGKGGVIAPHWWNGSSTPDLPHGRNAMIEDYDHGRNDGFARLAEGWGPGLGSAAMGYFDDRQIPDYWRLASRYVLADRYFHPFLGPTVPNRLYSIAGQAGGLRGNDFPAEELDIPTIFDQLEARNISWKYYTTPEYPALPTHFPRLKHNPAMLAKVVPLGRLEQGLRSESLAAVTYVDPEGPEEVDEHPPSNVTRGEGWTMAILNALMGNPQWSSTAVFLTWDESGGYFDHVPPPQVDAYEYGFRVPLLVISPFAKRGFVDHEVMDHTSLLKFMAHNWNLPYLTEREARANDLLSAFDFPIATSPVAYAFPGDGPSFRAGLLAATYPTAGPWAGMPSASRRGATMGWAE